MGFNIDFKKEDIKGFVRNNTSLIVFILLSLVFITFFIMIGGDTNKKKIKELTKENIVLSRELKKSDKIIKKLQKDITKDSLVIVDLNIELVKINDKLLNKNKELQKSKTELNDLRKKILEDKVKIDDMNNKPIKRTGDDLINSIKEKTN